MAPVNKRQPSYAGGEVSPEVYARVDLAKVSVAARKLQNFFVHPHGGASNRPGLEFITMVEDAAKQPVLVPFQYSPQDTYMLELADKLMRIVRNGALVVYPPDHPKTGQVVKIATPYSSADLLTSTSAIALNYAQSNAVMTFAHNNYPPHEVRRVDHHDWQWSEVDFQSPVAAPTGVSADNSGGDTKTQPMAYKVAAVKDGVESLPSDASPIINASLSVAGSKTVVSWTASVSGLTPQDSQIIYKDVDNTGVFGLAGRVKGDRTSFVDRNINADTASQPFEGRNPFTGGMSYPAAVSYHQQRRFFANTLEKPQTTWATQSGDFSNMSVSAPAKDDDALEFTIAAEQIQTIKHIVPLKELLLFTISGEWRVVGRDDEVLAPSSINPLPQSSYGTSDVRPLVIGSEVLFVQREGSVVRNFDYSLEKDRYVASDMTILARHLFKDKFGNPRYIKAWAYAQSPNSIIWCVMSDGALISLTYMKEHDVWAWCPHASQGLFDDVKTVPEGQETGVYFVVRRRIGGTWKRFIERLHTRNFETLADAFFVDCGLSYDDPRPISYAQGQPTVITCMNHGFEDRDLVDITHSGVTFAGSTLDTRWIARVIDAHSFTLEEPGTGASLDTTGWPNVDDLDKPVVRRALRTIRGMGHLEGCAIVGLADGQPFTATVEGGAFTLERPASRVHAGLGYVADFQTLDLDVDGMIVQGHMKALSKLFVHFNRSIGMSYGNTFDNLYPVRGGEVSDGITELPAPQGWDENGRVCLRQDQPLPLTIQAVILNDEVSQN